jgi:hypothetical protein
MAARGPRHQGDTVLVAALLEGRTLKDAAGVAHMGEHTARRRMQDPAFQRALAAARQEALAAAITQLTGATALASAQLTRLAAHAQQEAIQLAACRTILETAIKGAELLDLVTRIEALEAAQAVRAEGSAA